MKEFLHVKGALKNEIDNLMKSELEVKERTLKTMSEKQNLENMTSEGNNRILSDGSYHRVKTTVSQIKSLVDKNKTQDQDPLSTLLEIERHVDRFIKMFETAQQADEMMTKFHTTKIKSEIRQERNKKRIEEDEK